MDNKNSKLFENKTTYTSNSYIKFLEFHNKKFSFSYMAYTAFWFFMLLFCIIVSFNTGARIQGVVITIILVSFIAYRVIRPKLIIKNELNSDKLTDNNVNTFSFYDKDFYVNNNNGKFNYKYFMLYRVFETSDFFYLYVSKENAFLVSKSAFSLGTANDFSKFIKSKCNLKYKFYKN